MSENLSLNYIFELMCFRIISVCTRLLDNPVYVADDSLGFYMIELLLHPTYTTSSSTFLRESLHFTVSKVKFRMSMILFGRHPFILVLTMQNLTWIVGSF